MRSMFGPLAVLAALTAITSLFAQPDRPFPRPNNYLTNVQLAHGRLLAEVQAMAVPLAKLPRDEQRELLELRERAAHEIEEYGRLIAPPGHREKLREQFGPIDRRTRELIDAARRHAEHRPGITAATARISSALLQLDYAVNAGSEAGTVGELPQRLARQLEAVAGEMKALAAREVTGPGADKVVRDLDRLQDSARRLVASPQQRVVAERFSVLRDLWRAAAGDLRALELPPASVLQLHAAQFDQAYRNFAALLGPNVNAEPLFGLHLPSKKQALIAVSAGPGGPPTVRLFQDKTGANSTDFMPYEAHFRGGVRIALGDVNGDGVPDIITAPGPGMPPLVRIFDGRDLSLLNEFLAYEEKFVSGLFVAVGDFNRVGRAEIITGADAGGGPHVRVYDVRTGKMRRSFFAYDESFLGGVRVAVGNVDGGRSLNIVTAPGQGMGPVVRVFDFRTLGLVGEFNAYDPKMNGGVWVTTADITRDGKAEIVTGADHGGPHVRIFRGPRGDLLGDFFAYDQQFEHGARVAVHDLTRDGDVDILTVPGPGLPVQVRVFDGRRRFQPSNEFLAFPPEFRGGGFIAAR
ncbi:MAG: hypothetical protein ACJ8F7_03780 [Gemmataceae bacterium]